MLCSMSSNEGANRGDHDYRLLKRVLDALLSQLPDAKALAGAERLLKRGYLYKDAQGRFRLSDDGKTLLRKGAQV